MTSSSSDSDFHVTFNLPSSAAALLKQLADGGNQGLRDLGVVSVRINNPTFLQGCSASARKTSGENDVPLQAESSNLDKLSLSCHSFPPQDDLESTRQNIRHYLRMQSADTGSLEYVIPHSNTSAPTQPLELPRHISDMRPVNTLSHSLSFAEGSTASPGHRLASTKSFASELDHGHQKRNADAEYWKPACSSYWNWQQNHHRLPYADVAVDGCGSHSGLARPVSPMYARSPPYAFNPCSPRLRTGYQMLPPTHFQEPFAHLEHERAWQHASHTTSPYLMNLLHNNSSHAAKHQRLAGPFETVLALPPGQPKKKFHRSRKDVATARSESQATGSASALGCESKCDGPGTLSFGPGQSSFAFLMAHNLGHPDTVAQNQQIYAATHQSTHVSSSQANVFSAASHVVSTSSLVMSPPAIATSTSAHIAATAAYVMSPSHAMLTTACAVSTSHVSLASACAKSTQAHNISTALGQIMSATTNLMSSSSCALSTSAHVASAPTQLLSTSPVFLTSAHVTTPHHMLSTSAHAMSLSKDVLSVPVCHVMSVASHVFSATSANAITTPVQVVSAPSLGIMSPAIAISAMKQIVTTAAHVTTTPANFISPLTRVGSAHISPEFLEQQYFKSSFVGSDYAVHDTDATDESRPERSSKSKFQGDSTEQYSFESSKNSSNPSLAEQVCNGQLEKSPDLILQMSKATCSEEENFSSVIVPAVGLMGSINKDKGLIRCSAEMSSTRENVSACYVTSPMPIIVSKAISSRKPGEDAEPQQDSTVTSLMHNPSSTVKRVLQDAFLSVSSSLMKETTSSCSKGSISANTEGTVSSEKKKKKMKKLSPHRQTLCSSEFLDLESDYRKKRHGESVESNSKSAMLPPASTTARSILQSTEEVGVSTKVFVERIPATVDKRQARVQSVDVAVGESVDSEQKGVDGSQANAVSLEQSVCNATDIQGSSRPAVDPLLGTADSAEGYNGISHDKGHSLEFSVKIEQTVTDSSQKAVCSRQAVVSSTFKADFDADCGSNMQTTVYGASETSSDIRIDTGITPVTIVKLQNRDQNACSNLVTASKSEQIECNNQKEIVSNIGVSVNGVESVGGVHSSGYVCNSTTADAQHFPINAIKTTIDTSAGSRETSSMVGKADNDKLVGNSENTSQNCHLLDGNAKLVSSSRQAKNSTDDIESQVAVASSEEVTVTPVQPDPVNLRLKLPKEELLQNVIHSADDVTSKKESNFLVSGELSRLSVSNLQEEFLQKVTSSLEDELKKTASCGEVTELIEPCTVDGKSSHCCTTASEGGQKNSVFDVSLSSAEGNVVDTTSVFQYAKSSASETSTFESRTTLPGKHLAANCSASLSTSMSRIGADADKVILDGTVSKLQEECSDQMHPGEQPSGTSNCDITVVNCDSTAGASCQDGIVQPNGLIHEVSTSSEVSNVSDSHTSEQSQLIVSSRSIEVFTRHCVAEVGLVSSCSAETLPTFALNSPLCGEVSLSSKVLPSLPPSCLTVKREDELSDRELSSKVNCCLGFDEAASAVRSEVLHSDSKTVSLSVAPTEEILASVSLDVVPIVAKSCMSHSFVRQSPVSCATLPASDHVFFSKDAKSSVFDEVDALSGPLPAKRLRTSDTN